MVRNDAFYPFASRIGYKDAEAYWLDASSFRLVRFISVPFLNLTAKDDFLTSTPYELEQSIFAGSSWWHTATMVPISTNHEKKAMV
jgi:hypothetical protein